MNCFYDIVNKNVKNIGFNIVIIVLSIILSVIKIYMSYYIGKIKQNKQNKDIFIFIGLVVSFYVLKFLNLNFINTNLINIFKNFIKNVVNKVFDSKFGKLLKIKDNILEKLNLSITNTGDLYSDLFNGYIPNLISILSLVIHFYFMYQNCYININIYICCLFILSFYINN